MLKVGDRIINRKRTDDKLPSNYGKGVILKVDNNSHYFISWDLYLDSWAIKDVIELDIQGIREDKLNEILNETEV